MSGCVGLSRKKRTKAAKSSTTSSVEDGTRGKNGSSEALT